jgi:PBSX family phage terminase large subunit
MLVKELKPIIKKINESRLELTVRNLKNTESLIQLRGWEAIETLRGQAFDFIVIDEIAMMKNFWINWQEVIRPTLTDKKGQVMFISTPKGFNHFYDLYNLQDTDFKSFHYTSYDNPYLPVEELEKAKAELPENRFEQEYNANFKKTEGLVYKYFDRDKHVTDKQPNQVVKTICGIDWGWTNPASVHRIRIDNDRHYWIDMEFYKTQQSTEQIIQWAQITRASEVYPDPAEPDRLEEARKAGLNVRDVSKEIEAGISKIQELFKQNRIHIHPECKNLIWELETYSYPEKKAEKNEAEIPIKENDHALDEIRYALYMQELDPVYMGTIKTAY